MKMMDFFLFFFISFTFSQRTCYGGNLKDRIPSDGSRCFSSCSSTSNSDAYFCYHSCRKRCSEGYAVCQCRIGWSAGRRVCKWKRIWCSNQNYCFNDNNRRAVCRSVNVPTKRCFLNSFIYKGSSPKTGDCFNNLCAGSFKKNSDASFCFKERGISKTGRCVCSYRGSEGGERECVLTINICKENAVCVRSSIASSICKFKPIPTNDCYGGKYTHLSFQPKSGFSCNIEGLKCPFSSSSNSRMSLCWYDDKKKTFPEGNVICDCRYNKNTKKHDCKWRNKQSCGRKKYCYQSNKKAVCKFPSLQFPTKENCYKGTLSYRPNSYTFCFEKENWCGSQRRGIDSNAFFCYDYKNGTQGITNCECNFRGSKSIGWICTIKNSPCSFECNKNKNNAECSNEMSIGNNSIAGVIAIAIVIPILVSVVGCCCIFILCILCFICCCSCIFCRKKPVTSVDKKEEIKNKEKLYKEKKEIEQKKKVDFKPKPILNQPNFINNNADMTPSAPEFETKFGNEEFTPYKI